ncbi:hypothetical protein NHX12_021597 [Muraenolepis orangiensis]|uniref:Uncharacterized protein n=1 Tax=Muraenolepis orangiensis TaxID=630683 RepID=A0A9Q0EW13_9TELE|nr:hypothetical protein NHX12_017130 [Muraenolepis orangiensis]KAJ3611582.1 hypothetical protein NHX12_021597 [Muraenolepis orangiensis]
MEVRTATKTVLFRTNLRKIDTRFPPADRRALGLSCLAHEPWAMTLKDTGSRLLCGALWTDYKTHSNGVNAPEPAYQRPEDSKRLGERGSAGAKGRHLVVPYIRHL